MNARVLALLACAVGFGAGCEPEPAEEPFVRDCTADNQCGGGNLCIGGDCVLAECNPALEEGEDRCGADGVDRTGCCRIIDNCNALTLTCVRDPDFLGPGCDGQASCVSCLDSDDCPGTQDAICADGRCQPTAGLEECGQEVQCPSGAHCDPVELFCVPDACSRCSAELPGLCCGGDEICDAARDVCVGADEECTVATEAVDCRVGEVCNAFGSCVSCLDDSDCGFGTVCDTDVGRCVGALSACSSDDECTVVNPLLRCIASVCASPECLSTGDCQANDPRAVCEDFACVLPPAVCAAETDEPNNSIAAAVALADINVGYSGSLCRGDTDFISFPVRPLQRYTVTVTLATAPFSGVTATVFNTTGGRESGVTFAFVSPLPVLGVTSGDETGRFVVAVSSSGATELESWRYSLTIEEAPALPEPDCSASAQAGQEPNDSEQLATALVAGAPAIFARCGSADVDFFVVEPPPITSLNMLIDGFADAEGRFAATLTDSAGRSLESLTSVGDAIVFFVGEETLLGFTAPLFVRLSADGVGVASQSYRVTVTAVPRPPACAADRGENDGLPELAQALPTVQTGFTISGSLALLRCGRTDVDHATFTLPAGLGGSLALSFSAAEGTLSLRLSDGVTEVTRFIDASGVASIDIAPVDVDRVFVARVGPVQTSALVQPYGLALSTFDARVCLISEPSPDNTFATARCVGDFDEGVVPCNGPRLPSPLVADLAACVVDAGPGCGHQCVPSDPDNYRLGTLEAGRSVVARLAFDPAAGDLGVALARVTGTTVDPVVIARDDDGDGVIDLGFFTANAPKEHLLLVFATGTSAQQEAQPYALAVDVSDVCVVDVFDSGGGNATPATATPVRADPTAGEADIVVDATLCSDDVDVYGLLALQNEELTWRLVGAPGLHLQIGTAPANLNNPALPLPGGDLIVDDTGSATLTLVSARVQQLFVTIDGGDGVGIGAAGSYALTVDFAP